MKVVIVAIIAAVTLTLVFYPHPHAMPRIAWNALSEADQYQLLSIKPHMSKPDFYGHEILGETSITDTSTRARLNNALDTAARESDGKAKSCFNFRHGIRVTHAGVTTDFLICFECRQVQVIRGNDTIASFLIGNSQQTVFDDVLRSAGVPLAPMEP